MGSFFAPSLLFSLASNSFNASSHFLFAGSSRTRSEISLLSIFCFLFFFASDPPRLTQKKERWVSGAVGRSSFIHYYAFFCSFRCLHLKLRFRILRR